MPGSDSMIRGLGMGRNRPVISRVVSLIWRSRSSSWRASPAISTAADASPGSWTVWAAAAAIALAAMLATFRAAPRSRRRNAGQAIPAGLADGPRGLIAADQDQRAAGGVVKGAFQGGEHRGEQVTQPVDPTDPVGHQVGPVGGEPGQLGDQLLRSTDLARPGTSGRSPRSAGRPWRRSSPRRGTCLPSGSPSGPAHSRPAGRRRLGPPAAAPPPSRSNPPPSAPRRQSPRPWPPAPRSRPGRWAPSATSTAALPIHRRRMMRGLASIDTNPHHRAH